MIQKVRSLGLSGVSGYDISVECFLSQGLPSFEVVGLPDTAVRESRERVRAAIKSCDLNFPISRITVNLAPADTKKAGTVYDLPILLGILAASSQIAPLPEDSAFFGELSLDGKLRGVSGSLPMALSAAGFGIKKIFVPVDNAVEASFANDIEVYPVSDVSALLAHLDGSFPISPCAPGEIVLSDEGYLDFYDVKGQEHAKRALEVAAAGSHNILLSGPPGSGKSMLAKRLASILPEMSHAEALESTNIYSVAGYTNSDRPFVKRRPFRSPHHTISPVGLSGGGTNLRPGEISLAHNGVLFLDELPEFSSSALEILRQPLEDGSVTISRVAGTVTYPSRFMLVCAMNPCKCGWYGHPSGRCTCTKTSVINYHKRISGPLLDRIDIFADVPSLEYDDLRKRPSGDSSKVIRQRVNAARELQRDRYKSFGVECNAYMDSRLISRFCGLSSECESLMQAAFNRFGLTARSYDRTLRVARTIADLDGGGDIQPVHLAEAIQYRRNNANL